MKRWFFAFLITMAAASTVNAWNNKGHMAVARLAWNELNPMSSCMSCHMAADCPRCQET